MTHKVDLVMDFQYGSTGKGLIAGWLAKRGDYDLSVCAFATNAGHTYIDKEQGMHLMTQQLPTGGLVSKTVKYILLGPGSLIHAKTLLQEIRQNYHLLEGKQILIHPHAAVVEDYHAVEELDWGLTKIGSTTKGVGAAAIERIKRDPANPNVTQIRWMNDPDLDPYVCTIAQYNEALNNAENVLVEGAQGFSLSMYHGMYPYTTSRDVTPWQIAADCGLPYKWAPYIKIIGTVRTFPIRVNNRDGSSGPIFMDQEELPWGYFSDLGIAPELTTVTKLKRRIFTFSQLQMDAALFHCGAYWETRVFLNFANYCQSEDELRSIVKMIETPRSGCLNPPTVSWIGWGADDSQVEEHSGEFS